MAKGLYMKFLLVKIFILLIVIISLPYSVYAYELLSLADCILLARSNSPALKTTAWDIKNTSEAIVQKRSSQFPKIDAQLGYNMQLDPQAVIISGRIAETQEADYLFSGISATYTLYDFGRRTAGIKQANLANFASINNFKAETANVAMQVIEIYFGILEGQKLIEATIQEITQLEEHHRVAQALFDEGVVTRNDLLQADVRLASVRQKMLTLKNRNENRWLQLNYLTGKSALFRANLDEKTTISTDKDKALNEETVLARRGEIMALRFSTESAESLVSESRSNFLPEIYSRVGIDYVQNKYVREQAIMSAIIGIKFNIFDGFASTANLNKAVLARSKSLDSLRQVESLVRLEIDTANNDRKVATERIAVAETSIKQSKENLRINQERYKERVGTATEVLDAQTMLTQSQVEYYSALFDQEIANARYQKAIGKLI